MPLFPENPRVNGFPRREPLQSARRMTATTAIQVSRPWSGGRPYSPRSGSTRLNERSTPHARREVRASRATQGGPRTGRRHLSRRNRRFGAISVAADMPMWPGSPGCFTRYGSNVCRSVDAHRDGSARLWASPPCPSTSRGGTGSSGGALVAATLNLGHYGPAYCLPSHDEITVGGRQSCSS
jgi:hypothetical protein